MSNKDRLQQIIKSSVLSEKTYRLQENSVLTLKVASDTNKVEIAQAVKAVYGVDVISVNILNVKGKTKNRGNRKGRRSDVKKAYVKVPADQAFTSELEAAAE